jgi:hypothetical protein
MNDIDRAIELHPWIRDEVIKSKIDNQHVFLEQFTYGEMHTFPGVIVGKGAVVPFHYHDFPHLMILYPGDPLEPSVYQLEAIRSTGEKIKRPIHPMGFAYIEAGIEHELTLMEGRFGMYVCVFCLYSPDGRRRLDPKQWTSKLNEPRRPQPFRS